MKISQFEFTGIPDLERRILQVKTEREAINAPMSLYKIFCDEMDADCLREIQRAIERIDPTAEYVGFTTNGNILDGCRNDSKVIIGCTTFEKADSKVFAYQYEFDEKSNEELNILIDEEIRKHENLVGVEFFVTIQGMSHYGLLADFKEKHPQITVFGGGAFNRFNVQEDSLVFIKNSDFTKTGFAMLLYEGTHINIETLSVVGWKTLGTPAEITSCKRNIIYELNNEPAFDFYSKYLGVKNNSYFIQNSYEFPLLCRKDKGDEFEGGILRTPNKANADGSIELFSSAEEYKYVRLTYGDPKTILDSINQGAKKIVKFQPEAINIYSCSARLAFWGDDASNETQLFQQIAPTIGFYTSGEILSDDERVNTHNETLVVVAMREGEAKKQLEIAKEIEVADEGQVSLNNRLVHFIRVASGELEEANTRLDELVKEVESQREDAIMANAAKSDFLANMSHEIRTPINAILGFDTMILRESNDEKIRKFAMDIQDAGRNLLKIINEILDLSKIESGKMEIVPVEYEFTKNVIAVSEMMKLKAEEKGLKLLVMTDPCIPPVLYGDDQRIRQIIINLINNAVKYTDSGKVTLTINGDLRGDDVVLHFTVSDTGCGIEPEDMDKLFKKFERIKESKHRDIEGSGLGLNIAVRLLALMNSTLKVESTPGVGSTFSFDVVQKVVKDSHIETDTKKESDASSQYGYKTPFTAPDAKVLVVDDNDINREVFINLLSQTQMQMEEADGGERCLEMCGKTKYDLIFMDHMMPGINGVDAFKMIRESERDPNRNTPIVILTANAIKGAREEYLNMGFDGYIPKPLEPDYVEEVVRELLPKEKIIESK